MDAALVYDGSGTVLIPPTMGQPCPDQLNGTPLENLGELSSRICYDSLGYDEHGKRRGRPAAQLHQHILEVKNHSVYEHCNYTVRFTGMDPLRAVLACANRKGVWVEYYEGEDRVEVTANFRAVIEWARHSKQTNLASHYNNSVQWGLRNHLEELAPAIAGLLPHPTTNLTDRPNTELLDDRTLADDQVWISLWLYGSRGFCYDDKTEVLTESGWKLFRDADISRDRFATLNPVTHELEYQRASEKTDEPWDGAMYRVKSQMVDLFVTPNHRMYVKRHDTQASKRGEEPWRILTAAEVYNRRIHFKKNARWNGEDAAYYEIPGNKGRGMIVGDRKLYPITPFLRMLGYWISEGWLEHSPGSGYQITISQNEGPILNKIIACVAELGYQYNIKPDPSNPDGPNRLVEFWDKDLYQYLRDECAGGHSLCYNKRVPSQIKRLKPSLIAEFLNTLIDGDGNITRAIGNAMVRTPSGVKTYPKKGGHRVYYTSSKRLADDVQELALKTGQSARVRIVDRIGEQGPSQFAPTTTLSYVVSFARESRQEPLVNHNGRRHDSFETYKGRVYCVTVPNGILYVRRNGVPVWCGNSHEQVRHRFAMSQRSTRYVDEDGSPYITHPLVAKYLEDPEIGAGRRQRARQLIHESTEADRRTYRELVGDLQRYNERRGLDRQTARKQARGAARGYLGNALATEMIYSAPVSGWHWILSQRKNALADAEIRQVYSPALEALKNSRHGDRFAHYRTAPSPDGLGTVLT